MTEYLPQIIGQESLKKRLEIYSASYKEKGKLPFLFFDAQRGAGKTKIIREWRKTLENRNGDTPPIMEANAASIKNAEDFFSQIFPVWDNQNAILFIDEAHNLPDDLEQILLTALERDPNPVRRVTFNHREQGPVDYTFDFRRMSIIMATTDAQKVANPLRDRLTSVSIARYSNEDLFKIFEMNLTCQVSKEIKKEIMFVFRGHPRACVELAEELDHFAEAHGKTYINRDLFLEFCNTMDIHPYGLNGAEMEIVRILGERGACSLTAISSATGHSKQAIQQNYEDALLNKGLMDIDSKRMLTSKGRELYLSHFVGVSEEVPVEAEDTLLESKQKPVEEEETPVQVIKRAEEAINGMAIKNPLYRR